MNKKKLTKTIIVVTVLFLFFVYVFRNFENFKQVKIYNFWPFFPLVILSILFLVTNGVVLKELLLPFRIKLSAKEWFGLSVITTAGNLLTPLQGGMITRAMYLKSKHNFSYTNFLSALSGIYIIVFWVNSLVAIAAMLLINYYYSVFSWLVFITFLAIFLSLSFIIVASPKIKKTFRLDLLNKIAKVVNGWLVIKNNKKTILTIAIISLINVFFMSASSFLEFQTIGVEISFIKALFISIVSTLSLFVSLTPGSLGIREAFVAFTSSVVGISSVSAVTVSILDRLVSLIPLIILTPIFSKFLFGEFNFGKIKNNKNLKK